MKKMMKKLIAMAAALVMIVTLLPAVGAKADSVIDYNMNGKGVLNIYKTDDQKNALPGAKFTIYQIASLDANGWAWVEGNTAGLDKNDQNEDVSVEQALFNKTPEQQRKMAATLANATLTAVKENGADRVEVTAKETGLATFDKLELGIYLVKETEAPSVTDDETGVVTSYVASAPFLVSIPAANNASDSDTTGLTNQADSWVYTVNARPKNEQVTIGKTITGIEDEENANPSTEQVKVGDKVEYTIKSISPTYTDEYFEPVAENNPTYKITDTLSKGLTLLDNKQTNNEVTTHSGIVVTYRDDALTENTHYTVTVIRNAQTGVTQFEVNFDVNNFLKQENYQGGEIKIVYQAEVNNDAVVGTGMNNDVKLDFNNAPDSETFAKPGTTPKVYTYGLKLTKVDASNTNTKLDGAEFELYKVDTSNPQGVKITNLPGMTNGKLTTVNGSITFTGLDVGEYFLKEVKAPESYTLLTDTIHFTIADADKDGIPEIESDETNILALDKDADDNMTGYVTTTVTNNKGFSLPSTGGMGTYLFTIGGIVIMAGAAFALIAMKKRA